MLKQLHINIPLVEALELMSSYAKFIKDILSKKRSTFLQNKLSPKMKDPGSFTLPCYIGDFYCGLAQCDL
ncbi:hypothetical protein EPI10_006741 [Gossypium australe]|uniref:Uncharacterized protein n=1 Tax=Gossypium australe TaxID=47621 RepID=A0A5B6WRY5_9ROSI|nr:hypothetical protein EPI10_006741 [Gossypium australe]